MNRVPREGEAAQKVQGDFARENRLRSRAIQAAEAGPNSWETSWIFDR